MATNGLGNISNIIGQASQATKEGVAAGLSNDEIRQSISDIVQRALYGPFQGMFQQAQQTFQQAQQPQYQMAQTIAPSSFTSQNEQEEEKSAFETNEDKERKRSPWHERMDESLGTEGVGGFINDMLSASPLVAAADTIAPEWAFNPASKKEIAEGYAQDPIDFSGDYSMPSGDVIANMTPEQRQEWQDLTTEGLITSGEAALGTLPIGNLMAPVTEKLGHVMPKAAKQTVSEAQKIAQDAAKSGNLKVQRLLEQNATNKAEREAAKRLEENAKHMEELRSQASKAAEAANNYKGFEGVTKAQGNQIEKAIMKKAGKGKDAPIFRSTNPADFDTRYEKLGDEAKNLIRDTLNKAAQKNGKLTSLGDEARAIRDAERIMNSKTGNRAIIPAMLAGAGALGLATLDESNLGDNLPLPLGLLSGPSGQINSNMVKGESGAQAGSGEQTGLSAVSSAAGSASGKDETKYAPTRLSQADEYNNWIFSDDPAAIAFREAYGDLADNTGIGYMNLLASNNRDAWEAAMNGIPGWWARYGRSGVEQGNMDALMDYLYGDNALYIDDLFMDQDTLRNIVGGYSDLDALGQYLWNNYRIPQGNPNMDNWDYDDFRQFLLMNYLSNEADAWNKFSDRDVNAIFKAAGEGYDIGLFDPDDPNALYYAKDEDANLNPRTYRWRDIAAPNTGLWNMNPYMVNGNPSGIQDTNYLDTLLATYNRSHNGKRLGVK